MQNKGNVINESKKILPGRLITNFSPSTSLTSFWDFTDWKWEPIYLYWVLFLTVFIAETFRFCTLFI